MDGKQRDLNYNCSKCPEHVQKQRRCNEDRWDFTITDSHIFPITPIKYGPRLSFCPSKLFRDDHGFALYLEHLYVCWKLGLPPNGGDATTMTVDDTMLLSQMIMTWESLDDQQKFHRLGEMLGGSS